MKARRTLVYIACWMALAPPTLVAAQARVLVKGGVLSPIYPASPKETKVSVRSFHLDRYPVTHAQFCAFVQQHTSWSRNKVARLFADSRYLSHWLSPNQLGPKAGPTQPVTYVSWFAAKAYCESHGARLPTEDEWEYAAQASETQPDGRSDPRWKERVLAWYTKPNPAQLGSVGSGLQNYWGLHDMHGLVWEWVLDFNRNLVSGEAREGGDAERMRFCGAGSLAANEKEDYPSFMRLAFRSSLKAKYTTGNLGFRCAADAKERRTP